MTEKTVAPARPWHRARRRARHPAWRRAWRRPVVRRSLLGVLLLAAALVTVLIMRGELRMEAQAEASLARPVSFGTWKDLHYGSTKQAVTAQARVTGLERYDRLTKNDGTVIREDGATYVVAIVECRCPVSEDVLAPQAVIVDSRGRQWEQAQIYGTYTELSGLTKSFDIGTAENMHDGVTRYGVVFLVPNDATGLRVFIDPYGGNYLYGD